MTVVETVRYLGCTITVSYDEDCPNPRKDWEPTTTMVCFHSRYHLGDENHGYNWQDYGSNQELEEAIRGDHQIAALLPVYLLDHSGLRLNTSDFRDHWDSGQVGFVFMTVKQAVENWGEEWTVAQAEQSCKAEVEEYNDYLSGNCYGYEIKGFRGEEESCWGFLGDIEYCIEAAKEVVNEIMEDSWGVA